jgi:hypothetical protein
MKKLLFLFIMLPVLYSGIAIKYPEEQGSAAIPDFLIGRFRDDYGITYTITQQYFLQEPSWKYHIIRYDSAGMFLLARNDKDNDWEPGKYSRIDFVLLNDSKTYPWGYCITTFDANSAAEAETKARANRNDLKKGCGGYPFSRMKRIR